MSNENLKARKERQAAEGAVAMAMYVADRDQLLARTAKLREERLAREAVDALLPPPVKPVRKKKKPTV